ncbi:hypothetical protein VP01_3242g2 [Puccinia sorghi]|uniref:Uncharacterized protein n=1 Tax=Puccinia sorghi TaxID=27349 RepID=A0A0L6UY60_9BASI|nr:hypothetical protein VP01_3242g2 [Puccinia sorghi]
MTTQSTQSPSVNPTGYGSDLLERQNQQNSRVTTPVKRPGMIQPSSDSQCSIGSQKISSTTILQKNKRMFPLILKTNHKLPQSFTRRRARRLPRFHPISPPNQPWTLAHPRLSILLKPWTRKMPKLHVNLKPPSTYKCLWCKKEVFVSGSKYQMAYRNIIKPLARVPKFLPPLCRKLKTRQIQRNSQSLFFFHKIALVVNYGLKKLGLEAPPPPKLKKAFLGSVTYSNIPKPIPEEDEYFMDEEGSDCEVVTDDVNEGEEYISEEENDDDTGNKKDKDEDFFHKQKKIQ